MINSVIDTWITLSSLYVSPLTKFLRVKLWKTVKKGQESLKKLFPLFQVQIFLRFFYYWKSKRFYLSITFSRALTSRSRRPFHSKVRRYLLSVWTVWTISLRKRGKVKLRKVIWVERMKMKNSLHRVFISLSISRVVEWDWWWSFHFPLLWTQRKQFKMNLRRNGWW